MLRIVIESTFAGDTFDKGAKGTIINHGFKISLIALDDGQNITVDNNQFKITGTCTGVYVEKRFLISAETPYCDPVEVECGYIGTLEEAKEQCHKYRQQHYPVGSQDILTIYELQSDGTSKKVLVLDPMPV